jgi:hypothetical protein
VPLLPGKTPALEVEVGVVLHSKAQAVEGPQGWSLSLASQGCVEVASVTTSGLAVETLFDDDGNPSTPMTQARLDLGEASFRLAEKASGDYPKSSIPGATGVISAVVLDQTRKRALLGDSTSKVLKVTYRYTAPIAPGDANPECRIAFLNGLKGQGQPVKNVITINGRSRSPLYHNLILRPIGIEVLIGRFTRGNVNDDGRVDLSDAVWIVEALVPALGGPSIACLDAGDVNGDERLELADAIFLIEYLFRSGRNPPSPFPGCGPGQDPSPARCPAGSVLSCDR